MINCNKTPYITNLKPSQVAQDLKLETKENFVLNNNSVQ